MFHEPAPTVAVAFPDVYYTAPLAPGLRVRGDLQLESLDMPTLLARAGAGAYGCMLLPPHALVAHGPFRLLPGMGVVAEEATGSERLLTTRPLDQIACVSAMPSAAHLVPLVTLLFLERGLAPPTFVDTEEPDAVPLVSGDTGLARLEEAGHDLGVLWRETTELPLVLGAWACVQGAPHRLLRMVVGEASRGASENSGAPRGIHYTILSRESDSLRAYLGLLAKHGLAEATEEAIAFC